MAVSASSIRAAPETRMRRLVQIRARSGFGAKHLIAGGIDNHAADQFARALQSEGHIEHRKSVREVGSAVERIDIPAILRRSGVAAAFFGDDGVRGEVFLQALDDEQLTGAVGFRHQIVFALELEAVVVLAAAVDRGGNERGRLASDFNGCF